MTLRSASGMSHSKRLVDLDTYKISDAASELGSVACLNTLKRCWTL